MPNGIFIIPKPENEPVLSYAPGAPERMALKAELEQLSTNKIVIPLIIGGKEVFTETKSNVIMPHKHSHVLAECCQAGEKELALAIDAAQAARENWEMTPWEHRSAVFLKAAELFSVKYRALIVASTMLCQSKVAYQAEIDSPCELVDFLRFNVYFADQIYRQQPDSSSGVWNRLSYRPLDGFVLAVSPFNFTAIGANLCTAPAMLGNTLLWKPSSASLLSNYYIMKILMEAGLPAGVINFVPASGKVISRYVIPDPRMSGFHFTGSTDVFGNVWRQVGENIRSYHSYPRLVGETGGKDFIFAHKSADIPALVSAMVGGLLNSRGKSVPHFPEPLSPNPSGLKSKKRSLRLWPNSKQEMSAISEILWAQ